MTCAADRTSVIFPVNANNLGMVARTARAVAEIGARRLWFGQLQTFELHQLAAYLAGAGVRIPMGSAVTLTPLRHPFEAALQARSVAAITGLPYVAGYGPGGENDMRLLVGAAYRKPAVATAEYLRVVRDLIDGTEVRHNGEHFSTHVKMPPLVHPPIEIAAGVLRPRMARSIRHVADVAVTWMTPSEYVAAELIPALSGAARVATVVPVGLSSVHRDPYELASLVIGNHLARPHYTDMLRRAGVPADYRDPVRGVELVVDSGTFCYGSPDEVAADVLRHYEAGIDEVILHVGGVGVLEGADAAVRDLKAVFTALRRVQGQCGDQQPNRRSSTTI